ncbi:hypothetical protein, partial [Agrobacterium rubi]|uniref:hypothetical protein n=2 Tax=Agrobacterium rubi TaxID=28099 RepID=UPI001AEDC2D5
HGQQQLSRQSRPGVFSLKRDRQSLFQRTAISNRPASLAAHVSLSSIFNCQKTDTHQCQKNLTKTNQGLDPKDKTRKPNLQFSQERRTSSLAAPPPSSVSGLIEEHPETSQQPPNKKNQKISNTMNS